MKKLIDILLIIALLSTLSLLQGCATVIPINVPQPLDVPAEFMQPAEEQSLLTDGSLRDIAKVMIENNIKYKKLSITLYHLQQIIIKTNQNMEGKE